MIHLLHDRAGENIEKLDVTFDEQERIELMPEFHRIVQVEQTYTFLYAPKRVTAWSSRLANVWFLHYFPHTLLLSWYFAE